MGRARWNLLHSPWILVLLVSFGCADDLRCDVKPTPGGMLYSVTLFKGTHCMYTWETMTSCSLASSEADEVSEPAVKRSNSTLQTRGCLEKIRYRRDCQEKTLEVICEASCSGSLTDGKPGEAAHNHWVTGAVCGPLLVLMILGILGFIYCRRRRAQAAGRREGNEVI